MFTVGLSVVKPFMTNSGIQKSFVGHFVYLEQFSYSSLSSYLQSVSQGTISLFICMADKLLNLASRSLAQSPLWVTWQIHRLSSSNHSKSCGCMQNALKSDIPDSLVGLVSRLIGMMEL